MSLNELQVVHTPLCIVTQCSGECNTCIATVYKHFDKSTTRLALKGY